MAEAPRRAGLGGLLRETGSVGLAGRMAVLTTLNALTEGAGLVLLVPVIASLGADGGGPSSGADAGGLVGRALAGAGINPRLETLLVLVVALVLLRAVVGTARDLVGVRLEARLIDGLRLRAWRALVHCDWRTLSAMRQSDTASLLITDVDRVGSGLRQLIALATGAATLAAIALAALAIAPGVALGAAAGGGLVLLGYKGMRRRAGALGERLGEAYRTIYSDLAEGLGALRLIKSFGAESASTARIETAFAEMRRAQTGFMRDYGMARIALQGGGAVVLAGVVWLAIRRWEMGAAAIIPIVALFVRALPLLGTVQEAWQNWAHARPALDEALALIAVAEDAAEAEAGAKGAGEPALPPSPDLAVTGVTVRHAARGTAALDAVSAAFPFGSITALTGASGAGKSTLADVLCGMIGPDAGVLTVGGAPVAGAARRDWRERVAYVQQEPVLFHCSIRDNLRWGRADADDAALAAALRAASAEFVLALPDGLDTIVGDRGTRLSGGERQRIALARGLLRRPDLLILDEVTSALDAENEAAVAGAIARLKGTMTILIIGHRGVLAGLADRRLELAQGRVVSADGQGK